VYIQPNVVKCLHRSLLVVICFWASSSRPSHLPHANILHHLEVSFNLGFGYLYIQTATVYFIFFGLPTDNAVNLLPVMPSIMPVNVSSPQGRPVFVL
ncbi:MAG: hypothetical protein Q8R88_16875, partial [Desulfoprunum sp.]|nr:hypothetical protein [Desulfoprunum sp.]